MQVQFKIVENPLMCPYPSPFTQFKHQVLSWGNMLGEGVGVGHMSAVCQSLDELS